MVCRDKYREEIRFISMKSKTPYSVCRQDRIRRRLHLDVLCIDEAVQVKRGQHL